MTEETCGAGRAGERGAIGGLEALPFSVLIFVFGSLLLVNAWGVVDAKLAVTSASREATRTFAESNDPATGAAAAQHAADDAIRAYGRDPERLELDGPHGQLERCGTVSYTATYPVPALRIPLIGGYGRGFDRHVDPHRAGRRPALGPAGGGRLCVTRRSPVASAGRR